MRRGFWIGLWLLLVACSDGSPPMRTLAPIATTTPQETDTSAMTEAEQFVGQDFPASATNIEFATQSGIDTLYYIQFDANPTEVSAFVAALGANLHAGMNPFPSAVDDAPPWWNVSQAKNFAGDGFIGPNGRGYEVMVEESSPQLQRVFMRVFDL